MTETPEGVVVTQELLRCPFCGAQAQWIEDNGEFDRPFGLVTEHTETCFMGGRMMAEWETIITAWNTRAHTPTLRGEEVERLREALEQGCALIQEAKGLVDGPGGGTVTDHLDFAEHWIGKVDTALAALSQPLAVDTGQSGTFRDRLAMAISNGNWSDLAAFKEWADNHSTYPNCYKSTVDDRYASADRVIALLAATPAPSVSPDPAGEASKRVEQLLATLFPDWDADQREHIAFECATAALASSPIPKTFPREAERERGQAEGFAAAVAWLRERSAIKPPATLHHAASILADQLEQSRIPASAALPQEDRQS